MKMSPMIRVVSDDDAVVMAHTLTRLFFDITDVVVCTCAPSLARGRGRKTSRKKKVGSIRDRTGDLLCVRQKS